MQVGVIMGGVSSEKEISLLTGNEIIDNLDKDKYEVVPIPINTQYELIDRVRCLEFAFIALHGKFGEDGRIQAILESMGVPFSGCGVLASALCMNKDISKKIFVSQNIKTPEWVKIKNEDEVNYSKINEIGYPVIVKPNNGGSSIGIIIAHDEKQFKEGIKKALKYDEEIIIEKYIDGDEITCCMLNGEVLPILSIKSKYGWFNYDSKYDEDGAKEEVIELTDEKMKKVEKIAYKCWDSFKLKVYARIDMIVKDNEIYVLEINTLPGMTKNSLLPKSAAAYGLNFSELLDKIIEYSLE
ncbi:D-alanine--D-alanine ligase [Haloimpatiens sp. FM7330]|uniref:D-alanine--D-alanine ligase n=1 Tax=Haloimpatiens sp. FM7330 TaxID=3298610 RepID=UPI003641E77C